MKHLPPSDWGEISTVHDLAKLETRIDARFDELDVRIDCLEEKVTSRFENLRHDVEVLRGTLRAASIVGSGIMMALVAGLLRLAVFMVQSR